MDLSYLDNSGQISQRRIWPLSVVFLDRTLMLLAWCCLRQGFRRFHLDKMSDVTLTPESFRPRRVALLREFRTELRAGPQPGVGVSAEFKIAQRIQPPP